jgi:hypothetical protein
MLHEILIALDQLLNTLIPGGYADETISSRSYRCSPTSAAWARARTAIDWLALRIFRQADHCHGAYLNELSRAQLPPAMRGISSPNN